MTEQEAKGKLLSLQKGRDVVVVAGRKYPKGVRGTVAWIGQGNFGTSVGFSVPGEPKLLYTSPNNLQVIFPGLSPGEEPEGGWVALLAEVRAGTIEPKRGATVRFEGTTGEVFWARDGRVGFKDSKSPTGEGIFKNLDELHLLLPDGTWAPCVKFVRAVPAGKKPAPSGFVDLSLEEETPVPSKTTEPPNKASGIREYFHLESPLTHLPPPFSDIAYFVREIGQENFSARSFDDLEICSLPEETVMSLLPQKSSLEGEETNLDEIPF